MDACTEIESNLLKFDAKGEFITSEIEHMFSQLQYLEMLSISLFENTPQTNYKPCRPTYFVRTTQLLPHPGHE